VALRLPPLVGSGWRCGQDQLLKQILVGKVGRRGDSTPGVVQRDSSATGGGTRYESSPQYGRLHGDIVFIARVGSVRGVSAGSRTFGSLRSAGMSIRPFRGAGDLFNASSGAHQCSRRPGPTRHGSFLSSDGKQFTALNVGECIAVSRRARSKSSPVWRVNTFDRARATLYGSPPRCGYFACIVLGLPDHCCLGVST